MRFRKIKVSKTNKVELVRVNVVGEREETIVLKSSEPPLGSFTDSVRAFAGYVIDLLDEPGWAETLEVTTLHLSENKDGDRGLIVTALRPVKKAHDNPLVVNTPLVSEPSDTPVAGAFTLTDEVLQLIELAESEATRYVKGERAQLELMESSSENAANFDDRAAAAEVASTRKPRGKRPSTAQRETSLPELNETGPAMTDERLQSQLAVKGFDIPLDAIGRWLSTERDGVVRWLTAPADSVLGQATPECVNRDSTGALFDEAIGADYEIVETKEQ